MRGGRIEEEAKEDPRTIKGTAAKVLLLSTVSPLLLNVTN